VFIVFFQGARSEAKITKISESFGAHIFQCSDNPVERKDALTSTQQQLAELETVLLRTREVRSRLLHDIVTQLPQWASSVKKEKAIYHQMNLFNYDVNRKCLLAEGWCPRNCTEQIQLALRRATDRSGALIPSLLQVMPTRDTPPTFYDTNKFTDNFQAIVSSYGVPAYRELNPTPLSLITFPFQFAIMFGDLGHGFMLTLFAAFLVYLEDYNRKNPIKGQLKTFYQARYLILLMGIFSMYCGTLYNEAFSVPMNLFETGWRYEHTTTPNGTVVNPVFVSTYPFGVDPAWGRNLAYSNPMKMKMSIIVGVIHMTTGIVFSALNDRYFGHAIDFWYVFVPEILFFSFTFGYLSLTIFYKWSVDWSATSRAPPSLINMLINMVLKPVPGMVPAEDQLFPGQHWLQFFMIIVCVLALPTMLLAKPFFTKKEHEQKLARGEEVDPNFAMGEVAIGSLIHTIEFALGSISNTASYLRLFALSLAHSQLSEVFWERTFVFSLFANNIAQPVIMMAAVFVWALITLGILLVMEALSAFLHALRLHWVEFQSKFYNLGAAGSGYKFSPWSYVVLFTPPEYDS